MFGKETENVFVEEGVVEEVEEKAPTQIDIEWNGTHYTLEFDRASAMRAEKTYDLSLTEVTSGKASAIMSLFHAAFIKHHPRIKPSVIQRIWDSLDDKPGLYEVLVGMYGNCAGSVLEDSSDEGNAASWKAR